MISLKLTQKQVEEKYKKFAMEMFGWEMNKPVYVSSRMTRTWGYYSWKIDPKTKKPELICFKIAERLINGDYEEKYIDNNIKHELIHWYTDVTEGKPCHHNSKWKANCRKFGIADSRCNNYPKKGQKTPAKVHPKRKKPDTSTRLGKGEYHECICGACKRVVAKSKNYQKLISFIQEMKPTCVCGSRSVKFYHPRIGHWIYAFQRKNIYANMNTILKRGFEKRYGVIIEDGNTYASEKTR